MTRPPDLKELDEQIERLNQDKEEAVANQDFERAASLRDQADKLKKKKETITREWRERSKEIDGTVDEEVVAEVVSKMTGIPLTRLETEETTRLLRMEEDIQKKVISQTEAIKRISEAVRRSRAGLKDPKRPIGSFIFAGPTGVGKTLLAKALAEFMFGDSDALIQIDMSEYMEKHNVSRLIGAPPGYVGYEEGGQLTEKIRRRPYAVVLLDEIEKAHPDVYNTLLQIMEEGRLTDSFGRNVDFKNTIIIMTTNAGAEVTSYTNIFGFDRGRDEAGSYEQMKERLKVAIEKYFRPEFLNRLDDVIVFHALNKEDLKKIVDIELAKIRGRMSDRGLELVLTDEAKEFLIVKGYNPDYGARPLRRAIENLIENPLSRGDPPQLVQGQGPGQRHCRRARTRPESSSSSRPPSGNKRSAGLWSPWGSEKRLVALGRARTTDVGRSTRPIERSDGRSPAAGRHPFCSLASLRSDRQDSSAGVTRASLCSRSAMRAAARSRARSTRTTKAGTRIGRTRNVSSRMPSPRAKPSSRSEVRLPVSIDPNVPAMIRPHELMMPPVWATALRVPSIVPCIRSSSITRAISRML